MDEKKLHDLMVGYAGNDYAEPRSVEVSSLDLEDFTDKTWREIADFAPADAVLEVEFLEGGGGYVRLVLYRWETTDEVTKRLLGYRREILGRLDRRRAVYEAMKREYEG